MTTFRQQTRNRNFFSPVFLGWWGHVFGSENFEKFWPHMGFPPEILFQNSSIFSNKSHRWCLVVRLSAERSVYKDYYRKKWTFQSRCWVENCFGVMIFRFFWFQKHALVMVDILVKNFFSYLKVELSWVCDISDVTITSNHRNWIATVNLWFLWEILCE